MPEIPPLFLIREWVRTPPLGAARPQGLSPTFELGQNCVRR
jgi:hypothetical protein